MQAVAARAVQAAVDGHRAAHGRDPDTLFLRDGPYGIPELDPPR